MPNGSSAESPCPKRSAVFLLFSSWDFRFRRDPSTRIREPKRPPRASTFFFEALKSRPEVNVSISETRISNGRSSGEGIAPAVFRKPLEMFELGMPPHGGLAIGLERLTAQILGLQNVREATLYPTIGIA